MKEDKTGVPAPEKWVPVGDELMQIKLVGSNDEHMEQASGFARGATSGGKNQLGRASTSFGSSFGR